MSHVLEPDEEPEHEPAGPVKLALVLLHATLMNFVYLLVLLLPVAPIVATSAALCLSLTEPSLVVTSGMVGFAALASVVRVWLRLLIN